MDAYVTCWLPIIGLLFAIPLAGHAKRPPTNQPQEIRDYKFDEWGNIPFKEEKERLDYIAQQLHREPDKIVFMEILAGKRACVHEARARAMRAKNYLVRRRKINAGRIRWKDCGYRDDATTVVWLVPSDWSLLNNPKAFPYLKPVGVKFDRNCKLKSRRKRKIRT